MSNKTDLSCIFKILEEFLDNISDEEFKLLLQNKCTLSLTKTFDSHKTISKNSKKFNATSSKKSLSSDNINKNLSPNPSKNLSFINDLKKCENLSEAYKLFNENSFLKKDLLFISKNLNVHILSKDKKEEIIKKIINFTIGSKLNSNALQNLDLTITPKQYP
ncbi:hypothetical protein [Clostridium grantii]|uniref:Uncharacterized protein n=1 Tax=Clostridium grantii DSM 8605 TaxID=1121316 RepID=A0A1M5UYJ8_9CLOT|nr:hypothetical protein [Clostridium grantii]SHH67928.1 hypothetical protein SAMN02745207_01990 [Clostridium grantii DSM 8605]